MNQEEKKVGLSHQGSRRRSQPRRSRELQGSFRQPRIAPRSAAPPGSNAGSRDRGDGGGNKGKANQGKPGQSSGGSCSSTTLGDLLNWKRAERENDDNND